MILKNIKIKKAQGKVGALGLAQLSWFSIIPSLSLDIIELCY